MTEEVSYYELNLSKHKKAISELKKDNKELFSENNELEVRITQLTQQVETLKVNGNSFMGRMQKDSVIEKQ